MDYGQPVNSDVQPEFFTTGVGVNQENSNSFEAENNLDLTNNQVDWTLPEERSRRGIGNVAINAPEIPNNQEVKRDIPEVSNSTKIGQIVNLEMPPGTAVEKNMMPGEIAEQAISFDKKKIKTKEKLDDTGVQEVRAVINKLNQDGNAADFYEAAREMMEANMENSYGENATWKGGKVA